MNVVCCKDHMLMVRFSGEQEALEKLVNGWEVVGLRMCDFGLAGFGELM